MWVGAGSELRPVLDPSLVRRENTSRFMLGRGQKHSLDPQPIRAGVLSGPNTNQTPKTRGSDQTHLRAAEEETGIKTS